MSSRGRRRLAVLVPAVALLVLTGCQSDPEGAAAHADDPAFAQCVDEAGESSLPDDPSVSQEREWLSRPGVLTCVADELDAGQRTEVLARAFPSDDDPDDDDWAERRAAKRDALVAYVGDQTDVEETVLVDRVASVMQGLEWDGVFWHTPRQQVAFALVRAREGADEFDAWLTDHPLEDRPATWSDFLDAEPESEIARRTTQVREAIEVAQDQLD